MEMHGLVLKDESQWEFWEYGELTNVYLISDGLSIKIGMSIDPPTRMRALQTGSSRPLELLFFWPGGEKEETRWHERFHAKRGEGEWFSLTPADVEIIRTEVRGDQGTGSIAV
jgi:hypothetical protein